MTSKSVPPQTVHFTASLCVAVTPHARHIDTLPDFARSRATASARALVAAEALFGMNRSIASSITALVHDRMSLLEGQAKDTGAGDPFDLLGHVLHPLLGFGRPSDALLGAHVETGHLEPR